MRLAQDRGRRKRDEGENEGYNVTQCGTLLCEIEWPGFDREQNSFSSLRRYRSPIDFLRDRNRQACTKKLAPIFHNETEKKIFEEEFIRPSHRHKLPFHLLILVTFDFSTVGRDKYTKNKIDKLEISLAFHPREDIFPREAESLSR